MDGGRGTESTLVTTTACDSVAPSMHGILQALQGREGLNFKQDTFMVNPATYAEMPPELQTHMVAVQGVPDGTVYQMDRDAFPIYTPSIEPMTLTPFRKPTPSTVAVPKGSLKVFPYNLIRKLVKRGHGVWDALDAKDALVMTLTAVGVRSMRKEGRF